MLATDGVLEAIVGPRHAVITENDERKRRMNAVFVHRDLKHYFWDVLWRCIMDRKAKMAGVGWMVVALLPLFTRGAGANNPVQPPAGQPDQQIAVETIRGTVTSVGTFRLEGTSIRGVRLRIKTESGQVVRVHTGPRSYLERQQIRFRHGDQVTVSGWRAKAGQPNVLVASQIKRGGQTVALRTREGNPLWNREELKSSQESGSPNRLGHSDEFSHAYEW